MTIPIETYPLPPSIATVKVKGQYRGPDGRGLQGTVTFTGPGLLTFPDADLFIAGPVVARLDEFGAFTVTLPATDNEGMNPSDWSYTVKENLTGVTGARTFALLLPKGTAEIDLADVAPADPTTPTYVPVPGPQGEKGDTGLAGSQVYTGSTVPADTLGANGDVYNRYETTTFLGVTSTTVTTYGKSAGTWVAAGSVRGAAWYVNTGATSSTDTKPGDMLLRTDTGDVWQRSASGWGNTVGNLKGPQGIQGVQGVQGVKGDTGATGAQGPKGDTGATGAASTVAGPKGDTGLTGAQGPKGDTGATGIQGPKGDPGSGSVNSVNGDLGPDIVLDAADVSAIPASAKGVASGVASLGTDGKVPTAQLPVLADPNAVTSVNGLPGPTVTLTAASVSALAASTKGAVNGVASLDAAGDVPIAQVPNVARNEWNAKALGFEAWSCDPYGVANPVAKYLKPARLYFVGFNITESTTVDRIVLFARGYGGVTTNRYRAGIYREAGTKVVESASVALTMAGQEAGTLPGMVTNHIGAVPITIAQTVLAPGRYWVAFALVTGGTADFAYFHVQNEAPVATANFFMTTVPFARAWYTEGQGTGALPTTVSQTAAGVLADHDLPIVALANV
ncbi:hypothetical protein [Streptomyces sp. NPDC051662]|uniref:hypothetical protein n=1 Tax=Streptomyces sp. NPDC051662 TaxID=3154750 RepID=UPI003442FA0F